MPRHPVSALLGLVLLALPAAAAPPAPNGHSVLVVDAEDPWRPGYVTFMAAFQAALRDATATPVAVYAENLDLARFESPAYRPALRAWYEAKYGDRRLDAIVAVGSAVLGPLQAWRTEFWPDVPLVFVADARTLARIGQPAGSTGVTFELDPVGSARAALALRPDTRRIALVGGADPYTRGFVAELRNALGNRLEWIDLTGLRMAELRQRVATLPDHTFIFYTTLYRDGGGQTWIPRDALATFARDANRPTFSLIGTYLGYGIVGGSLFHIEILGPELARVVVQVLEGQPPASIPVRHVATNVLQFDWTELQRWGLDEGRLPPGSQVLNRPLTLWEQHRRTTLAALSVLVAQGLVIGGLLLERRRRQRAETNLRRLSGRLLTAQEEERRRIARDLHDGVNQKLSALSLTLARLGRRPPSGTTDLPGELSRLEERAADVAEDIRRLSHELHPGVLEHIGLIAALEGYCSEVEKAHGLTVTFRADEVGAVPADVALCLYRATQEALGNVVKHAAAQSVRISLVRDGGDGILTIDDDGCGFDLAEARGRGGLGLISLEERVRLIGGQITITTARQRGTKVRIVVRLPTDRDGPGDGPAR